MKDLISNQVHHFFLKLLLQFYFKVAITVKTPKFGHLHKFCSLLENGLHTYRNKIKSKFCKLDTPKTALSWIVFPHLKKDENHHFSFRYLSNFSVKKILVWK